ncbi:hypothetical protein HBI88_217640 [Parastagonospora nodorum]|nr:hypothetical protein HBI96_220590 [Parastagonospora nodorum]KAH5846167.1 hypothetical protein HBI91_224400 [Parastagonospora nodorum]KAH5902250.1 hypothetical protein HBI88_217640 [Parastagonospora nodorum]KAH5927253.1 hypothetical protein HBI87_208070 [Parastagonospora nodorum]KAH6253382.1 hypothetical protein HBI41_185650 [Parastagonospora nodorum]
MQTKIPQMDSLQKSLISSAHEHEPPEQQSVSDYSERAASQRRNTGKASSRWFASRFHFAFYKNQELLFRMILQDTTYVVAADEKVAPLSSVLQGAFQGFLKMLAAYVLLTRHIKCHYSFSHDSLLLLIRLASSRPSRPVFARCMSDL